jgi:hypothetical protein
MKFVKHSARPKQWTDAEKQRLARLAKRGADASEISAAPGPAHFIGEENGVRDEVCVAETEGA